jgi:hypothetical protein
MNNISKLFTGYIYKYLNNKKQGQGIGLLTNEEEGYVTNNTYSNTNKLSSSFNSIFNENNIIDNLPVNNNQVNGLYMPVQSINNISYQKIFINSKSNEISESDSESDLNLPSSFWKFKIAKAPKQSNSSDCGVFVCKFMDFISRDKEITFIQDDMKYFRISIGIELMEGKFLNN